jgi:rubrerythrin
MDERTHENLLAAMHGEAFAFARYSLFAAAARAEGEERIAAMLDGIASVELKEHFFELAQLAGLAGTTPENLAAAIHDENEEVEHTYASFAKQARAAGDAEAADRFAEIAEDEREHMKTLEDALERIEVPA